MQLIHKSSNDPIFVKWLLLFLKQEANGKEYLLYREGRSPNKTLKILLCAKVLQDQ